MTDNRLSDPRTWVDLHGDFLFRFALLRLHNPESAEEAVQETFLAALKSRDRFEGRSSERTWLAGILKNKTIDLIRRSSREKSLSYQDVDGSPDDFFSDQGKWKTVPASWPESPDLFDRTEFWEVFRKCMAALPRKMAQVFSLREMDDLPTEKICKALDLTPTNLWVILHRARLRLRACLESNWFTDPVQKKGS